MSFFKSLLSMITQFIQFEDIDTKNDILSISGINRNNDHEISYKEAATYNISPVTIRVTGETFKEFQYFTGLRVGKIIGQNLTTIYIPPLFQGNSTTRMLEGCPNLTTIGIFGPLLGNNANTFGSSHKVNKVIVFNEPMDILNSSTNSLGWFGSSNSTGKFYDKYNNEISSITVTDNINIESGILMKCISIHSIDCNNKVSQVKDRAFYKSSLQSITNASSITSIGLESFSETNLGSITANLVTTLTGSFASCLNLTEVHFQAVTTLNPSTINDRGCFTGDSNLVIVDMPALQTIGKKGFRGCTKLVSLNTTVLVTVGEQAFYDCSNFETLDTSTITTIAAAAFKNCVKFNIKNFNNTTSLAKAAFQGCTALTEIELKNNNLTAIGGSTGNTESDGGAFQGCTALTKVDAPNVTVIGAKAFSGCTNLATITWDWDNITSIGASAFYNCTSLPNTIEFGVNSVITSIADEAFKGSSVKNVSILNSVMTILSGFNNTSLTSITAPNVIKIDQGCFYGATVTNHISLPNVISVRQDAFRGATLSNGISIPNLTFAGPRAFYQSHINDTNSNIDISKLTHIQQEAFVGTSLTYGPELNVKCIMFAALKDPKCTKPYIIIYFDGTDISDISSYPSNLQTMISNGIVGYDNFANGPISPFAPTCTTMYVPDSKLSLYTDSSCIWSRIVLYNYGPLIIIKSHSQGIQEGIPELIAHYNNS